MVIHSGRKWLGIQWVKVTLYVHLRLHHGLLETILVNTLSDFREFKNIHCQIDYYTPFYQKIVQTYDI